MLEFIIMLAIVGVGALIFGKADTKREVLNMVGLDLSESAHENMKINEFEKYCKKALVNSAEKSFQIYADWHELGFLDYLKDTLYEGVWGEQSNNLNYLMVKRHYIKHALTVVNRRIKSIKENNNDNFAYGNYTVTRSNFKHYINALWDKYECPWPEDWNQIDKA